MNTIDQPSVRRLDFAPFDDDHELPHEKQGAAYLADALNYGMADEDQDSYMAGWMWGLICGICATLAAIAVAFAAGRLLAPLF